MENEFKNYKRELIQLNNNTVCLLHMFYKDHVHCIEDTEIDEMCDDACEARMDIPRKAAQQFFKQLEGEECASFVMALKEECEKYLDNWKRDCRHN